MSHDFIESSFTKQDISFEVPLRPQKLSDFIGQQSLLDRLDIFIRAAKERNEALGHVLFSGPPGLGKTTLANIMAKEMGTNLITTSGPIIEKPGDLAGILTNLQHGDIFFIDEIHRLTSAVEEYLYSAMEDFTLDILIDSGQSSRTIQVKLNKFTLIGATTRAGLLTSPLRSRFVFNGRLDYYEPEILGKIIKRSSSLLQISLDEFCSISIAKRSRGTPRIANNLLRWIRDYAQIKKVSPISAKSITEALNMLSIDEEGLDEMDKKLLLSIIDHHDGGPVGIQTLGVVLCEEADTIAEIYEPYLIMRGFLKRTPRGREATQLAYKHIGREWPRKNGESS